MQRSKRLAVPKKGDEAYEARKVSKSIGEYVDFEDIKKDKS